MAFLSLLLPPNRGALTAAEYVENFNYYMVQSQWDYRLTEEGGVVLLEQPNTVYLHLNGDLTQCLRFTFREEGGVLRAVTADYYYRFAGQPSQEVDLVDLPSEMCLYAFLSAAGADTSLFRINRLRRAAEALVEEHIQVNYRDLLAHLTVEGEGYAAYDNKNTYIA